MTEPRSSPPRDHEAADNWRCVRDALLVQAKLVVGGLVGVIIGPATIGAALADLVLRSDPPGRRFYRTLAWGRRTEEVIGLYAALDRPRELASDAQSGQPHAS